MRSYSGRYLSNWNLLLETSRQPCKTRSDYWRFKGVIMMDWAHLSIALHGNSTAHQRLSAEAFFPFFSFCRQHLTLAVSLLLLLLKRQSPPFLSESGQHPASYKHVGFHGNLQQAFQSKHLSSREKSGWVWRRVVGNGAGTFFQDANYTLAGTDGNIPLGLCLQLKAAFVPV